MAMEVLRRGGEPLLRAVERPDLLALAARGADEGGRAHSARLRSDAGVGDPYGRTLSYGGQANGRGALASLHDL
jgi:hypothetical protein